MDLRIGPTGNVNKVGIANNAAAKSSAEFTEALLESYGITVSKHAQERLKAREVSLDREKVDKIANGIDELSKKGVKEGVVILKDLAVVVGVDSKTIVTFKTPPFTKGGVFSQIDGAVILE
ncbi:hypothetical protein [Coprothermobacter platensis]|uniref:hypothetical protein n=1 Tax=Coprothermobacter platensis TaxID=108819 RepID=UPI00036DE8DC|nr:hypothetical protein [Coprothermobacter platensis]